MGRMSRSRGRSARCNAYIYTYICAYIFIYIFSHIYIIICMCSYAHVALDHAITSGNSGTYVVNEEPRAVSAV